jgi:hypothetical protein
MQSKKKQLRSILLALLIAVILLSVGCNGGGGGDGGGGDGNTDLMGTWSGWFDDERGDLLTDNDASMIINYQDASGFSGTATVYLDDYVVGGSVDEETGDIGMLLTPIGPAITIAIAGSELNGDILSGQWANTDPPFNGGDFSLTRQ